MKILKWLLIIVLGLALLGFAGFQYMKAQTKKASPEETVLLQDGDLTMSVTYRRPFKKEREIFGGLVPYGKVWRTGANEATTFTTSRDLTIMGQPLKAGTYTLWTIPQADAWQVIWNGKMYGWGVDFDENAQRQAEHDVVNVTIPVEALGRSVEQFTITLEPGNPKQLVLVWDLTRVAVPLDS